MMNPETPFLSATAPLKSVIDDAKHEAETRGQYQVDTIFVLRSLFRAEGTVAHLALAETNVVESDLTLPEHPFVTSDVSLADLWDLCLQHGKFLKHSYPGPEHCLLAICCATKSRGANLLRDIRGNDIRETVSEGVIDILGYSWRKWRKAHPEVAQQ